MAKENSHKSQWTKVGSYFWCWRYLLLLLCGQDGIECCPFHHKSRKQLVALLCCFGWSCGNMCRVSSDRSRTSWTPWTPQISLLQLTTKKHKSSNKQKQAQSKCWLSLHRLLKASNRLNADSFVANWLVEKESMRFGIWLADWLRYLDLTSA